MAKKTDHWEFIVIGAGLSGLLTAKGLLARGHSVLLLEGMDSVGGNCKSPLAHKPEAEANSLSDYGLKFFPAHEESLSAFAWIEEQTHLQLNAELIDAPVMTYDNSQLRPLLGFGDHPPHAAAEFLDLLKPQYWSLEKTPKDWVVALGNTLTEHTLTRHQVTQIRLNDTSPQEITVNGSKVFFADQIYFCASPTLLPKLLDLEKHPTPSRLRNRLERNEVFTSINLDILHASPVTDNRSLHLLRGTNDEPCFGLFHPTVNGEQLSQWVSLIPNEQTDDSELIATRLKYMRRQIKRVYEHCFEAVKHERILVCPASHGHLAGALSDDRNWPKCKMLKVVSGLFSARRGVLGCILESRHILSTLHEIPRVAEDGHPADAAM